MMHMGTAEAAATAHPRLMPPTPWRRIAHLAMLGTLTMALLVLWDVNRTGAHPANLLQGGTAGPAAGLVQRDFPDVEFPAGLGLDGQQYYAMARSPLHLDDAAASLDRPTYRWQRPLFPWLVRAVHPMGGGGSGLISAFFLVGLGALLLGGMAAGALSSALGGRPWPAALFPLLPGAYMSLRVTMADTLALALVLAALALAAHRRTGLALIVGCLAVLTRETSIIVLVGWALGRRTRANALIAAIPIATAAAWGAWLRVTLPATNGEKVDELGLPFIGLAHAMRDHWLAGTNRLGMLSTITALAVAAFALRRAGRAHPLVAPIVCSLAFVALMNHNVIGIDFGATRSTMPLLMLSLLCLATIQRRVEYDAPQHGEVGMVGPGVMSGAPLSR